MLEFTPERLADSREVLPMVNFNTTGWNVGNRKEDVVTKIERSKNKFQGIYSLNMEKHKRFIDAYEYLSEIAEENGGYVRFVDFSPEVLHACFEIEVPILILKKYTLGDMADIISKVDFFELESKGPESMLIGVVVNNLWEAVS